jgi:hypothetical protein
MLPYPQAGGLPLVGCPQVLQYICCYHPYLEAFSIHILRMCHAMVTRDPPNMAIGDSTHVKMMMSHFKHWAIFAQTGKFPELLSLQGQTHSVNCLYQAVYVEVW